MQLFNYIRKCLATELQLIQAATGESPSGLNHLISSRASDIMHKIEMLRRKSSGTSDLLRSMEEQQESFAIRYHDCTKLNGKSF